MPSISLHPLPANPTTGQQPSTSFSGSRGASASASMTVPLASAAGGGGVNREVLKGLHDVAWSDDEDDPDCLVCAEPLDLSDLNFKPCQCGIQICQFCYNRLLTSDGRCPGCRRVYDTKAVVFQPVDWEEVKRAKEKKTRRAKTIKQLDQIGRRHLLGVRIVMKNMVCVVGMKLPAPGDEAIPILRTSEYFGQYGKISRIYLRDRTVTSSTAVHTLDDPPNPATATGIYIVYVRREDAARAITALDGFAPPGGPAGSVLRANYGTTRYCDAFLRGSKCDTSGCTNLHEWGGEGDCFTKDDYEVALTRPAEYDARQKQATMTVPPLTQKSAWPKPSAGTEEAVGLHRADAPAALPGNASWGKPIGSGRSSARSSAPPVPAASRSKSNLIPLTKNTIGFPLPTPSLPPASAVKREKKVLGQSMSRNRSTDSTQSTTGSSVQASPKKKPLSLSNTKAESSSAGSLPSAVAATAAAPAPPAGLSIATRARASRQSSIDAGQAESGPEPEPVEPVPTGDTGTESEAGPSSSSPQPQTPARSHADSNPLPPPLTSDPIFLHSPYEEPRIYTFPASDPDFSFELGLDPAEIERMEGEYRPSPYSKLLVGLAEMGVLASDLVNASLLSATVKGKGAQDGWKGTFAPFDAPALESYAHLESSRGSDQPGEVEEEEEDGPRTTSRFDFARPASRAASVSLSLSRGQSPFNLRTTQIRPGGAVGAGGASEASSSGSRLIWPPHMQQQHPHQQQPPLHQLHHSNQQDNQSQSQGQGQAIMASFYDSPGTERSWPIPSDLSRPPSHRPFDTASSHSHSHSHAGDDIPHQQSPHVHSAFPSHPSAMFQQPPQQQQQQQQQQQAQYATTRAQSPGPRHFDARTLQAFHQQAALRSGSQQAQAQAQPAGGYRRY